MRAAAIYARVSTDRPGVAEQAKSVPRQVQHARAFAVSQGWTVDDASIYVDDGISGAEFERRPGFMALIAALTPKPKFDVLIVSERKTIGREASETAYRIKQIARAGVDIVDYVHGRSLVGKNWLSKLTDTILGSVDEGHREQTRERVHEAHRDRALKGYVVGNRCFGYRNVDVFSGTDHFDRPVKSHVDREIVPEEAEVVVRIFELFDSGLGLRSIAQRLNDEGGLAPKPFVRKDPTKVQPMRAWSPSTVRNILKRSIYHGVVTWNATRKRDAWGAVHQRRRPEDELVTARREDLRIVPEQLWRCVAARMSANGERAVRFASGRLTGRPRKDDVKNLLAGLATCGECGGNLVVETSHRKAGRVAEYVCFRRRHYRVKCDNALRMPVDEMNEAVLQAIEEHALTPEAVELVVQLTERDDVDDRRAQLDSERRGNATRSKRLQDAIETGGEAATLVARIRELETRQRAIADELTNLGPLPRLEPRVVEDRLTEWRRLLRGSTTQARAVLGRILTGRIVFTPREDGYDFTAPTRFDRLFAGVVCPRPAWMPEGSGRGTEGIGPEDTFDGDYGRLLERAYTRLKRDGKLVASPTGFEPVS